MKLSAETIAYHKKFSGYFDKGIVNDSVPISLVELVYMIEHGPDNSSLK